MSWAGRRVYVTGADGFIGSHLVARLEREGAVVDRGSFIDRETDTVYHLGARVDLSRDFRVAEDCVQRNIAGTLALLASLAERPPRVLVYTSTTDVYGDNLPPWYEEQRERPASPYAVSKLAGEHLCRVYEKASGISVTIARMSTVYGPGQRPERLIPSAIRAFLRCEEIDLSPCMQWRDLVFVDDAVEGLLACAGAPGEIFNLGHNRPVLLREVVLQLRRMIDQAAPEPRWGALPERSGEPDVWASSGRKASDRLGWEPRVGLEEGLRLTFEAERARLRL